MELTGRRIARAPAVRSPAALPFAATACIVAVVLLLGGPALGGPLIRVVASGAALAFAHRGWASGTGRERTVRGWIILAAAVWFISELARLVGTATGVSAHLAELSVVGLAIGAIGAYVAAARRRLRPADEVSLYLD
ncbi:MAG: hypothetical protein ACRDFY_09980, partial [Candidatus Limnocylindria bacterium]